VDDAGGNPASAPIADCHEKIGHHDRQAARNPVQNEEDRHFILEFGVSAGSSLRWRVENSRHSDSTFVGFDSFEGLPEAWGNWPKGSFSTDGRVQTSLTHAATSSKGYFTSPCRAGSPTAISPDVP
jgi:hypothetical protein